MSSSGSEEIAFSFVLCRSLERILFSGFCDEDPEGWGIGSHFPVLFYEKFHSHLGFFQNSHSHFKQSIK